MHTNKSVVLIFTWVLFIGSCSQKADKRTLDLSEPQLKVAQALGNKALGAIDAQLQQIYHIQSPNPPAAIRPDPDLFVRRLIRQYRPESSVVAREIGRTENYRALLGGASEDFHSPPQEGYDSTSLLAVAKVSEELCEGLVAPNTTRHPGWISILPNPASEIDANIRFLAQRFTGMPSSRISVSSIQELKTFITTPVSAITLQDYVPVCIALSLDAETLLL